jgi:two-component system response regulator TctD
MKPSPRLLLVEDHPELSLWLGRALRLAGYEVSIASDGKQGECCLRQGGFDIVVLDLNLPRRPGMALLHEMRARRDTTPVLVLTARAEVVDRVEGLRAGADDYLPKPFELAELEARLQALLRRPKDLRQDLCHIGTLSYDAGQSAFYREGAPLPLPKKEAALLRLLFERSGRAVSKEFLGEQLLGGESSVDNVEVIVHRLRKRLDDCGVRISTLRGLGYMLERSP